MEATAFGVMAIDADRHDHRLRREAGRSARHAGPARTCALASMGIYVFDADYLYRLLEEDIAEPGVEPRLRQGHHPARGARGQRAGASVRACRASADIAPARRAVLARRRHDRCVLVGQPRPRLDHARARHLRHATGRSGPTSEQLPPAKFVPDRDGKHGMAVNTWSRAAASCRGSHVTQLGAVLQRAGRIPSASIDQAVLLPDVEIGRGLPADARS